MMTLLLLPLALLSSFLASSGHLPAGGTLCHHISVIGLQRSGSGGIDGKILWNNKFRGWEEEEVGKGREGSYNGPQRIMRIHIAYKNPR